MAEQGSSGGGGGGGGGGDDAVATASTKVIPDGASTGSRRRFGSFRLGGSRGSRGSRSRRTAPSDGGSSRATRTTSATNAVSGPSSGSRRRFGSMRRPGSSRREGSRRGGSLRRMGDRLSKAASKSRKSFFRFWVSETGPVVPDSAFETILSDARPAQTAAPHPHMSAVLDNEILGDEYVPPPKPTLLSRLRAFVTSAKFKAYATLFLMILVPALIMVFKKQVVDDVLTPMANWLRRKPYFESGPIMLAIYVLACLMFVFRPFMDMVCGYVFGFWRALPVASVSVITTACLSYVVCNAMLRDWMSRQIESHRKLAAVERALRRRSVPMGMLLRVAGPFPFMINNFLITMANMGFRNYFWSSWLSLSPYTLLSCFLGSSAKSLTDTTPKDKHIAQLQRWITIFGLCGTIVLIALISHYTSKALKREIALAEEEENEEQNNKMKMDAASVAPNMAGDGPKDPLIAVA